MVNYNGGLQATCIGGHKRLNTGGLYRQIQAGCMGDYKRLVRTVTRGLYARQQWDCIGT
jgi:hypothetical protein